MARRRQRAKGGPRRGKTSGTWSTVASAVGTAGRATATAAVAVAKRASSAWEAIHPDVRLHVADLPLLGTTLIGRRAQPVLARPDDGHRPLICVHGLAGHPQNFLPLRGVLKVYGRTRVYALDYDDRAPLEEAAAALARLVERVLEVNGLAADARVDLLAHSMGGIVARLALLEAAFAGRVQKLVTVATPHHGTLAARFLAKRPAADLRPGSELLARLGAQAPWPGPPALPRLIAFYSRSDILMLPALTAMLEGADNREIPGVSHSGYLIRPRALVRIQAALAD